MSIPLFASPPQPPPTGDLLSGDSSTFASSLGGWTATGGTLTRDTGIKMPGFAASAKHVTSSTTQYIETAVPGTFLAGKSYWAVVFISSALSQVGHLYFGLIGTDEVETATAASYSIQPTATSDFDAIAVQWTPTANRTGVKVRIENDNTGKTYYVGWVRVIASPDLPLLRNAENIFVPHINGNAGIKIGPKTASGLALYDFSSLYEAPDQLTGFDASNQTSGSYVYSEHAPGDLADKGINFEVGTDYVGIYASEKDSSTVQFYADLSSGYNLELHDRGTGLGWFTVNAAGTYSRRLQHESFEWAFHKVGALTVATAVNEPAEYRQAGFPYVIDEVRVHVGTAPTGATLIVDVNINGTTAFTTQANRPTVAISGTDATSGVADGGQAGAKNDRISFDVDQIGSTVAGSDLTVIVRGRYTH